MNDRLDAQITSVLHDMSHHLHPQPDVADVARRAGRRKRRSTITRMAVGAGAAAVTIGLLVAVTGNGSDPVTPAAPPPATTAPPCQAPTTLPFTVADPPAGWQINTTLNLPVAVTTWFGGGGVIEVWNGIRDDLPMPGSPRRITVLGRPASIGAISDGSSIVFDLGPTPCDRWALVAHPSVTIEELEAMSQLLTPI
jgi:hypothetical protein